MPEATVAAVIANEENGVTKILLTRRNVEPFKGQWCLPGGHIDWREPARDAIIREVEEEVGLKFDARFFGYFDEIIPEPGREKESKLDIHAVVIVFEGPAEGELRLQPDEVAETRWLPVEEARSLPLAFTHNEVLDGYAARNSCLRAS